MEPSHLDELEAVLRGWLDKRYLQKFSLPVPARSSASTRRGIAALNATKTQCVRGHPFNEENTVVYGGKRSCRSCRRQANGRWARRHRAQKNLAERRRYHRKQANVAQAMSALLEGALGPHALEVAPASTKHLLRLVERAEGLMDEWDSPAKTAD